MTESSRPSGQHETREHLEEARTLLHRLREKLDEHPELEEAITRLEMALNALTVKTGGML
jgi:predicted translin family RNA/ssDNA-binding protein